MPNGGIGRVLQFGISLLIVAAHLRSQAQNNFEWSDRLGNTRNLSDLDEILGKHRQWVESERKSGTQAELSSAALYGANLSGANLRYADLSGANLGHADLRQANLSQATLIYANLSGANLSDAKLDGANLSGARLKRTDLSGAYLSITHLRGADLSNADLSNTDLIYADLSGAYLSETDLSGANLIGARLDRATFEPKSLPELRGIAGGLNLELLTFQYNPDGLVQLRKEFEDGGFREQERKITYALKRREAELSCEKCTSRKLITEHAARAIVWSSDSILANCGSFALNKVFFDWTCQYGMSAGRPLMFGFLLWLLCSVLYFGFIHTSGESGLYRVYAESVRGNSSARRRIERISLQSRGQSRRPLGLIQFFWRECLLLGTSMFFSLMSAFNIGFRDINFGRWLRLLTRQEYDIKAVGWARVVAGWQALISVCLLALSVLTYFGRPFG